MTMVLYLSERESLGVFPLEKLLDNFLQDGALPEELKTVVHSLDIQGFCIGSHNFGCYAIINLDLPKFTISIKPKDKTALKGATDYSHV